MNRHQILTGAVNAGDNCYSVGSVEGVPFTAYTAGCNIVILASNFARVQIIPGILHGNVQVSCIDASTDVGKIAAAYGKRVCIFEPTPLLDVISSHKLNYKWIQTAALEADCYISVISWNLEGTKLLTGGTTVQMWHLLCFPDEKDEDLSVGESRTCKTEIRVHDFEITADKMRWDCVWQCRTASPACFLKFSPDGTLFVSAAKSDRLVKIWYESAAKTSCFNHFVGADLHKRSTHPLSDVNYAFIYIAHPRAITGISWRKTSKYFPRGAVANMLVTSCRDNICRLWVQTLLPEDGLVNFSQIESLANRTVPRVQTQRHRQKIMQRLKHIKSFSQFKKRHATKDETSQNEPIPNLPSTYSVHDFHSFGIHGTAMAPGFHFHLAASINAETDIPLVPSLISADGVGSETKNTPNFIIHWLNNKEMIFTQKAEKLLQKISMKVFQSETATSPHSDVDSDIGECELVDNDEEYEVDSTITAESSKKLRHKLCRRVGKKCKKHGDPKDDKDFEKEDSHQSRQSFHTLSSTSTNMDLSNESASPSHSPFADILDQHFEALLRDWHSSSDLLFSVHPVDGSLLVWLIEWLDETSPGSFRQAQVSFSSRFPSAIPLGDAATMSHNVSMYSPYTFLDLRAVIANASSLDSGSNLKSDNVEKTVPPEQTLPTPSICMITKHNNGSLNLWSIVFGEKTNFTQILSISHTNRVSGHRFRVNDIACHPVLPLLLTTSHHNMPGVSLNLPKSPNSSLSESPTESSSSSPPQLQGVPNSGFCSELILWKVEPVGPLSESGGVTELARINSPEMSAFSNVAWIPTLLPSTTLGAISNSPSACFIASDGHQLRVYQAVIDARTLLAEVSAAQRHNRVSDVSFSASEDSTSSDTGMFKHHIGESFKIVSLQSTSRPGCILELDIIVDAVHDWKNTQLLQVFQEQLIRGDKEAFKCWSEKQDKDSPGLVESSLGAVVDLRHSAVFEEPFYLVVMEKNDRGQSVIHMWKLIISSQSCNDYRSDRYAYVPDSNLIQDDSDHSNASSRTGTPDLTGRRRSHSLKQNPIGFASPLRITTTKVCTETLTIPEDTEVIHASPAAGHLSSSNIYPACFAPYLLCTACSDGFIRFWRCKSSEEGLKSPDFEETPSFSWVEWEITGLSEEKSSAIEVPGLPLYVSCAYSGRIACAYKQGQTFSRPTSKTPHRRYMNVNLAIYECESTGGSEWILEDTIHLRNIAIPETEPGLNIDIGPLIDTSLRNRKTADTLMLRLTNHEDHIDHKGTTNIQRLLSVPSYTTMHSLKKIISEQGNQFTLTQKSIVQLDWVSTEDGSHVLTVSVGSKISVFTPVSTDIAQANLQAMNASSKIGSSSSRMLIKQASSMAAPMGQPDDIRWMTLRTTQLETADGLPPLPMQMSWVRDGIFVVGMDNEMHIYTQWKSDKEPTAEASIELNYSRTLTEQGLLTHAQESSHLRLPTHNAIPRSPSASVVATAAEAKKPSQTKKPEQDQQSQDNALSQLPDFGIFEASRLACPVLPQYHPKQLMELLAFGKIHRVRAILTHLVMSLCTVDSLKGYISQQPVFKYSDSERSPRSWMRSRTLSIAAPVSPGVTTPFDNDNVLPLIPEEVQLNYTEITSVRPLPLFTLIEADFEKPKHMEKNVTKKSDSDADADGYDSLFASTSKSQVEETLDEILDRNVFNFSPKQKTNEPMNLTDFNPKLARLLTKLLTHSHLPGLSSLDQMHLLALADAVASFYPSTAEKKSTVANGHHSDSGNESNEMRTETVSADSLDDCGLRFLLTMRQHSYLLRCLPLVQRKQLQKQGLGTFNLVWAFHSETQEELVKLIPCVLRGNPKWTELKELGVGWWLRNNFTLKKLMEQVAKASFQMNQDPLDAALFYLAMKKKSLVWGLFRSIGSVKMTDFFQHNFTEPKWRKAALKNAYALLGKQRFEHAAAFFLLAGSVRDAIEVCLNKLDDLQLAMVIIRLYEGDIETVPQNLKMILYEEVLGCKPDGSNYTPSKAHPDPFLRSMSQWILQDYMSALTTLLETDIGHNHSRYANEDTEKTDFIHPSVFNFYLYLRTHPMIIRRQLAQTLQEKKGKELFYETSCYGDASTPFERRLYFLTAHQHFRAGCPSLALEVLSRLPNKILTEDPSLVANSVAEPSKQLPKNITTGSLDKSDAFDWSTPVAPKEESMDFDWGAPVGKINGVDTSDLKITISIDQCSDDDDEADIGLEMKSESTPKMLDTTPRSGNKEIKLDIMAQQLKFIACLKILMEELSTLATGFEVDGGQLRYHLYVWLEKSVLALKTICSYRTFSMRNLGVISPMESEMMKRQGSSMILNDTDFGSERATPRDSDANGELKPTLHEILLADKVDFEAKLHRSSRRKQWLQANEALLRTLLSYCCLHGSHGGGLASVRMELILLLQELQQERTQHQLLSPLPFPTTLPLLAASVACQKTVIADPIRHLHSVTHDILKTVTDLNLPPLTLPTTYSLVHVLRDLGISLSACVYQSLCDSDNISVKNSTNKCDFLSSCVVCPNSHLLAGNQVKRDEFSGPLIPTTQPNKWPGVQSLRALLARDKDEDSPKLHTLLCETYVAFYLSQLLYALSACDSHVLFRLIGHDFTKDHWSKLYGGGAKKLIHVAVAPKPQPPSIEATQSSSIDLLNTLSKQRMKLHMKILQQLNQEKPITTPDIKEDRPTYRELFIPPQASMLSYLMTKPQLPDELISLDYDSSESVESEDDDYDEDDKFGASDVFSSNVGTGNVDEIKYCDREQYAWGIMRCAVVKLARLHLIQFLSTAGMEMQDLATTCPSIHAVMQVMVNWNVAMKMYMDNLGGCPPHFLPNSYVETNRQPGGPAILKYKSILELNNTPFRSHNSITKPIKRLWDYLVRQEPVQEIFIRYIFGKPKSALTESKRDLSDISDRSKDDAKNGGSPETIRVVHKDQDSISSFCINRGNPGLVALATPKEIQELDMTILLEPAQWLEEEAEYDILNLLRAPESLPSTDYLVVQHPSDRLQCSPGGLAMQSSPSMTSQTAQTGRSTIMLKRHRTEGTRRMSSHPTLPLYLSGSQDGSVTLWEWTHQQPLLCPRPSGTFAKVTKVSFNQLGNKFGVTDGDGNLSLWQVALSSSGNKPFFSMQVHSKQASDFTFLGSSSLIVTAGHAADHKNVVLWDTLLPNKKSSVTTFACHEHHGSTAVLYAPLNQLLITGGRKGDVFIFDMRQRTKRHNFQAHESAVKCMTLDPGEDFFVTGSADGDIKVWSLGTVHILLYSFPGEHTRSTLFRNIGMGVSHLYVDSAGRLYSCGADGSMKLRQLPDRNSNIVCTL